MNDVYFLQNWGGGGSGLDYVILLSEGGGVLITLITEGGRGGGEKCQKFGNVICERPLKGVRANKNIVHTMNSCLYARDKVFLFGTPQTHPGKLVFDQFSSTADPLFGRSKNFIQKITQLCIYRFRYVLCICPKYVFMQVNTMYIYIIYISHIQKLRVIFEQFLIHFGTIVIKYIHIPQLFCEYF